MKSDFKSYLNKIAKDLNFNEGAGGIKQILVEIYRHGKISLRDLSRKTLFSPVLVSLIITRLVDDFLLFRDKKGICYTQEGMKYIEEKLNIRSLAINPCECCEGTGIEISVGDIHEELFNEMLKIIEARPEPDVSLDQAKCTPETLVRRLLLMHDYHTFDGTEILFLGDDDFMTNACMAKSFLSDYFVYHDRARNTPFHVTVVEVDERIVNAIGNFDGVRDNERVEIIQHDLRNPLPKRLQGKHDVVFIDPPYTYNGARLFFSRAIDGLRKEKGSRIFFSFGHVDASILRKIQVMIVESGFIIENMIPAFNVYEGANVLNNVSQMMVLKSVTEDLISPLGNDKIDDGLIYTAENKA
ncbi:MAG: bis-aminopropyl spermidine synthase family protein [Promethearchaeota archaeon]